MGFRMILAGLACAMLTACQAEEASVPDYGLAGYNPSSEAEQRAACEARGGTYGKAGLRRAMVCIEPAPDAGRSCQKASDCVTGNCLARSNLCAPITPLFGCNEILDHAGRRVTLCVD